MCVGIDVVRGHTGTRSTFKCFGTTSLSTTLRTTTTSTRRSMPATSRCFGTSSMVRGIAWSVQYIDLLGFTENLLENTGGVLRPHPCYLGTVACYLRYMLTCALYWRCYHILKATVFFYLSGQSRSINPPSALRAQHPLQLDCKMQHAYACAALPSTHTARLCATFEHTTRPLTLTAHSHSHSRSGLASNIAVHFHSCQHHASTAFL